MSHAEFAEGAEPWAWLLRGGKSHAEGAGKNKDFGKIAEIAQFPEAAAQRHPWGIRRNPSHPCETIAPDAGHCGSAFSA